MIRRLLRLKTIAPPKLGRWQLTENNSMQQIRKIDLANCDSCGTCTPQATFDPQAGLELQDASEENTDDDFIEYHIAVIPYHTIS